MRIFDSFNQLLMLLYKGLLLRKRHYLVTLIVEIGLPILIASIPTIIFAQMPGPMDSKGRDHYNATFYDSFDPLIRTFMLSEPVIFMYTPKDKEPIVKKSIESWINGSYTKYKFKIQGFDTEKQMEDAVALSDSSSSIIGTIFQSSSENSLNYKIRVKEDSSGDFQTGSTFQYMVGPRYTSAYIKTGFLSWQAAIEQTFIKMRRKDANFAVMMNRFPYPAYDRDSGYSSLLVIIQLFFVYSFIMFFYVMIKRVIEEKSNRSKELLRMMGMTNFNYWMSTFLNYFFVAFFLVLIITILYVAKLPNGASVLNNMNFFLLFFMFLLYVVNVILLGLITTILFNKANLGLAFFMILYSVPYNLLQAFYLPISDTAASKFFEMSYSAKLAFCLIPTGSVQVMFKIIASLVTSEGLTIESMSNSSIIPQMSLNTVVGMMIISCFILTVLIWYIDAVWPWQFGIPQPIYFPFTKSYWCGSTDNDLVGQNAFNSNSEFFEKDPVGNTPGVVIRNLTKKFKVGFTSKMAVDDVSLNIYNGQITALLGRNGAGKTTTVSMLTGLFPPDGGSASISGWNIRTNMAEARRSIGICPQDNILFPTLTVSDHLMLIAGMKGVPWNQMTIEVQKVLKLVSLTDKQHALANGLSGGMKRKLGLALAIIGNSKVLFLDEPTSGLDPENRRQLWDILLGIRHDKTIILTTHYMEEADILGDRIAIMVDGKIKCCGSSVFLKSKFGTGYHLNIAREPKCDIYAVLALLQEFIPTSTIEENGEKETRFSFGGNHHGGSFSKLFQVLETRKFELGISSFGMTVTTIDDVFVRVNTMELGETNALVNTNGDLDLDEGQFLIQSSRMVSGMQLWFNRVGVFVYKRFCYAKRNWSLLVTQIVFPFCFLCIMLAVMRSLTSWPENPPPLRLDLKKLYGQTEGFYDNQLESFYARTYLPMLNENGVSKMKVTDNPQKYVLDYSTNSLTDYLKKLSIGSTSRFVKENVELTAWFNGEPFHILPMSLTLMHTAILRNMTGDKAASISLTNAPLARLKNFRYSDDDHSSLVIIASVFFPLALSYVSASYVTVAVQECSSRAKLLQLMSGVSTFTYWFGMFLWDMIAHTIASIILLIPFAIFNMSTFFTNPSSIGSILLMLILFGWATIPMSYILSRMVEKPTTGSSILLSFNAVIGTVVGSLMLQLKSLMGVSKKIEISIYFLRLLPIFSSTFGLSSALGSSFDNSRCDRIPPHLLPLYCKMDDTPVGILPCCANKCGDKCFKMTSLLEWSNTGSGADVFFLILDGVVYFVILLFLETGIPGRWWERLVEYFPWRKTVVTQSSAAFQLDPDVLNEIQAIKNSDVRHSPLEALVAVGLKKKYGNLCAVNSLSFTVHKQECFGLLGVNGAGKTSTFKMLAGDIVPTEGDAFINGYSLQGDLTQFQSFIGYCPQFDALIDLLTGREMLTLFASIRGIPKNTVGTCVENLIQGIDLQEHADKITKLYSGGNKRKLSLGMALIGNPAVILLDEPTAGVDPISRRKIWHILSQARAVTGSAVVLCTHSMEECEALCSRLAIMVKGQFRCLGSIQHLKSKFGQGFTIVVKMMNKENINQQTIDSVKYKFAEVFPSARLEEYHQGVFNFYIQDSTVPWSYLFGSMEQLKEIFQLEDYFISGTSLEQIFLAFAHQN